jgi:hypothetical protein
MDDIFKPANEEIKPEQPIDDEFDPAIYYDNVPKRYKGKVEFIKPVSLSVKHNWNYNGNVKKICIEVTEESKGDLEVKLKEILKDSEGNLVVLQQPRTSASNVTTSSKKDYKNKADFITSVNGDLYKVTGIHIPYSKK